jgi:hypothetical protein
VCSLSYAWIEHRNQKIVRHPKAFMHFSASGFFEGLGALVSLMALGVGVVVVVSPIVGTTPLWNLLMPICSCGIGKSSPCGPR